MVASISPSNSMPIGHGVLGILITSMCNGTCRHGCNQSDPESTSVVPLEHIRQLIERTRDQPSVREVAISGGEPLLFPTLVIHAVRQATARGLATSVTTNAFWATSSAAAAAWIHTLRNAGLTSLCLSTSQVHQEFIPLSAIARAAEEGRKAGLQVTINVVSTPRSSMKAVRMALGALAKHVNIAVIPPLPARRGRLARSEDGIAYPCRAADGFAAPSGLDSKNRIRARVTAVDASLTSDGRRRQAHTGA